MNQSLSIRVLLIEDDEDVRQSTAQALGLAGFEVETFVSVEAARAHIDCGAAAVVVCDVRLPGLSSNDWLPEIHKIDAELPVILVTAHGHIAMAVRAMREGAYDFIEKPFTSERMIAIVRHAVERRQLALQVRSLHDALENWHGVQAVLIGRSVQMQQIRRDVLNLAETNADVLTYGETGTGKGWWRVACMNAANVAGTTSCRSIAAACRRTWPTASSLAMKPARSPARIGPGSASSNMRMAARSFSTRSKACRWRCRSSFCVRCRSARSSASAPTKSIVFDCRIVAASKEDLKSLSDRQKFRSDLYYRIGVAFIDLPRLRERREDIPLLFEHFVLLAAKRYERPAPMLSNAQLADLMAYAWPGNVRELHNVADRFVLGLLGDRLTQARGSEDLPSGLARGLPQQVERFERAIVIEELRRHRGDQTAAAAALGIARQTAVRQAEKDGRCRRRVQMNDGGATASDFARAAHVNAS